MNKNKNFLDILLKTFLLIVGSIFVGFILLLIVYFLPIDRILANVQSSIDTYDSQIITQWAGWTRYSHLSNTSDLFMISEAICRPYDSVIKNALLNPNYAGFDSLIESIKEFYANGNSIIENYPRYWHGNLVYIIPLLLFTNAGGIRTILMFVEFILCIIMILELNKLNKIYSFIFGFVVLFLNPITCAMSYQNADIFIIGMLFSIFALRHNNWLKENNHYFLFFVLNGIFVSYFDFLTYPLVAWAFPIIIVLLLNKSDIKHNLLNIILSAIAWCIGYVGMWAGKWILASVLTNENVIKDALSMVGYRTSGENYTYLDVLKINIESVIDNPMLLLYLVSVLFIIVFSLKQKKKFSFSKKTLIKNIPYILIGLAPFVWYFVIRNHSYIHPWFEYRELAVTYFSSLIIINNLFIDERD